MDAVEVVYYDRDLPDYMYAKKRRRGKWYKLIQGFESMDTGKWRAFELASNVATKGARSLRAYAFRKGYRGNMCSCLIDRTKEADGIITLWVKKENEVTKE